MRNRKTLTALAGVAVIAVATTAFLLQGSSAGGHATAAPTSSTTAAPPTIAAPPSTSAPQPSATAVTEGQLSDDVSDLARLSTSTDARANAMAERSAEWLFSYDTKTDVNDQAYKTAMRQFTGPQPVALYYADQYHLVGGPWQRAAAIGQYAYVDHLTAYQPTSVPADGNDTPWTVTAQVHTRWVDGSVPGGTDRTQQVSVVITCTDTCRLGAVGGKVFQ